MHSASEIVKEGVKIICGSFFFPGVEVDIDFIRAMFLSLKTKPQDQ